MTVLFSRKNSEDGSEYASSGSMAAKAPQEPLPAPSRDDLSIQQIVEQRLISVEFQPIVRLRTSEVVGYEAFARGPASSSLAAPVAMFQAAEAAGLSGELDVIAHAAAFGAALAAKLDRAIPLFVNADPAGLLAGIPDDLAEIVERARAELRVFVDVADQKLANQAATALLGLLQARDVGYGIAVDHVGTAPEALALLPFARPAVLKLGMAVVRNPTHPRIPGIITAASAYAAEADAVMLAEGIESEEHRLNALALGAVYGQGYFFSRPLNLPAGPTRPETPAEFATAGTATEDSPALPFDIAAAARRPINSPQRVVDAMATYLIQRAAEEPEPPSVVVSTGPLALPAAALNALQATTRNGSFVAMVTVEGKGTKTRGLNTLSIPHTSPLAGEMVVAVVSPHYGGLLVVRPRPRPGVPNPAGADQGDRPEEGDQSYVLVQDRATVIAAARSTLRHAGGPAKEAGRPG